MERYEIVVDDEGNYCGLIPSENGPLVQYADAQATIADLQGQVAQANKQLDLQKEVADNQAWWVNKLCYERDALQQRVAQLEGEVERAKILRDRWQAKLDKEECEHFMLKIDHAALQGLVQALPVAERKVNVSADGIFRSHLSVKTVGVGDEMTLSGTPELVKQIAAILRYRANLPAQSVRGGGGGENAGGWLWPRAIWRGVRHQRGVREPG